MTAPDVYIRFYGTKRWYRHDYSRDELATWAKRIEDAKPQRVWAYFNNDREGKVTKNARMFARLLKRRRGCAASSMEREARFSVAGYVRS